MSAASTNCGSILVVDDDALFRELISTVLRLAGYAVSEAEHAQEALDLFANERPHLVVLDVCLPRISGYEVCRALREETAQHVPIIFVSGERVQPLDRVAGLLLGADDYLSKPFAPEELLARVRRLLRREYVSQPTWAGLTHREHEVLGLLTTGLSQKQIAQTLVISRKTVGTHMEHIFKKLGAHNRAEAIAAAHEQRIGQLVH